MSTDWRAMHWLNPPPRQETEGTGLHVRTGDRTDFWQKTYYGFERDDGHFLHVMHDGEFTAETSFTGRYETLYDQAGLMIRHDELNWVKCGIEFTDGRCHFSTVVTVAGQSDWSAFALPEGMITMAVRATRLGDALFIQYRQRPEDIWKMARLAHFPAGYERLAVGITTCSPQRAGFEVTFDHFTLQDPLSRDIH